MATEENINKEAAEQDARDVHADEKDEKKDKKEKKRSIFSKKDEKLKEEIKQLKAQVEEQKEKYLRLFADFENFKRRTAKERLELIQTAGKEAIISILPALDDLDRAMSAAENATDITAVVDGMALIKNKLFGQLEQKGLKEMVAVGEDFDTEKHEAITEIPAPSEGMKGKVVNQIEKGYYLNDKIIRFAKVVVGK